MVVPQRWNLATQRKEALEAFWRDGAIILETVPESMGLTTEHKETPKDTNTDSNTSTSTSTSTNRMAMCASWIPSRLFGEENLRTRVLPRAAGIHLEQDPKSDFFGKPLLPHTDGYVWGDHFPDVVILLAEQPDANGGGANSLIDGERLYDEIDEETRRVLSEGLFDHTERRGDDGNAGMADGVESIVPVFRRIVSTNNNDDNDNISNDNGKKDRLCWRRMVQFRLALEDAKDYCPTVDENDHDREHDDNRYRYQSLWTPVENEHCSVEEADRALRRLDRKIQIRGQTTERFQLQTGEALVVDNFRMLHARDSYSTETERKMWRVWSWTTRSFGLPPEADNLHGVTSNLFEAEKNIREAQQGKDPMPSASPTQATVTVAS